MRIPRAEEMGLGNVKSRLAPSTAIPGRAVMPEVGPATETYDRAVPGPLPTPHKNIPGLVTPGPVYRQPVQIGETYTPPPDKAILKEAPQLITPRPLTVPELSAPRYAVPEPYIPPPQHLPSVADIVVKGVLSLAQQAASYYAQTTEKQNTANTAAASLEMQNVASSVKQKALDIQNDTSIPDDQKTTAFHSYMDDVQTGVKSIFEKYNLPSHMMDNLSHGWSNAMYQGEGELEAYQERVGYLEKKTNLDANLLTMKMGMEQGVKGYLSNATAPQEERLADFDEKDKESRNILNEMELPPDLKAYALQEHNHASAYFKTQLQDGFLKENERNTQASILRKVDILEKFAAIDPQHRQDAITQVRASGLRAEAIDAGIPAPTWDARVLKFINETAVTQIETIANEAISSQQPIAGLKGLLSTLVTTYPDDVKDATGQVTNEKGGPVYYQGMDPAVRQKLVTHYTGQIMQMERAAIAEKKAQHVEWRQNVREMLSEYKEDKLSGLPISPKREVQIYDMVKGTEFEKKYDAIKTKGESFAFATEKMAKDPLTFGAAKLGYEITPLNTQDPQQLQQQLKQRVALGGIVKANFGLTYSPVLTGPEAKNFGDLLSTAGTNGVQIVSQLKQGLGSNVMMGIARQVAAGDAQTGNMIALVAQGKDNLARTVYEGAQYIKDKAVDLPKEEDLKDRFRKLAGDSFRGLPGNERVSYEAWKSAYAYEAAKQGLKKDKLDKDISAAVFKNIVGDVTAINSKNVVIPDGYTEDRFKDSIKAIKPDTIKAMGGVYGIKDNEVAARVIAGDAQWVMTSTPGVYRPIVSGQFLRTSDMKSYIQFRFGQQ